MCNHLTAYFRGQDRFGFAYCPACSKCVHASDIFNAWIQKFKEGHSDLIAIQQYYKELKEAKERE
ncbi:hypothetical protein CMI37_09075 [Candidatus Pacearchaeota archaeon]|nr:hypothetical protein [Candidatus Pacearchaeota archaeon]